MTPIVLVENNTFVIVFIRNLYVLIEKEDCTIKKTVRLYVGANLFKIHPCPLSNEDYDLQINNEPPPLQYLPNEVNLMIESLKSA